jgi:hypothetical protein
LWQHVDDYGWPRPRDGFADQRIFGPEMTKEGDFVDARLHCNASSCGAPVPGLGVEAGGSIEELVAN